MGITRDILAVAGLAILTTSLGAATMELRRESAPIAQAPLVFRGGVDYVPVDVVVTDGHEQPMTGLTAADFEILDGGKPQKIADFRFVNVPLVHRKVGTDPARLSPASATADVATNAPATADSRLFVLIVDDLHLVETVIVPVQRLMTEFIENLSPNDQAAVLFVGHSNLSQNFTNDRTRLLKAVSNVRAAFGFGIGVYSLEQLEELPYARDVAWQLRNVTDVLGNSNYARRAVVFVGAFSQLDPGAPIGTREFADQLALKLEMDDVFASAKRADVPIYTLDPRGIPNDGNALTARVHVCGGSGNVSPNSTVRLPPTCSGAIAPAPLAVDNRRAMIQQDHLAEIAINTGGRFFVNRSDLLGAMDEILTENGSFYELGYYPNPSFRDGKFHDIKVKVGRAGAHVRARQGYVAASAVAARAKSAAETLATAMGAGLNVSGLSMRAYAAPLAASTKGMRAGISVEVTYPIPTDGPRRIDDDLRVSVMALDPDGKIQASQTRPWHVEAQVPTENSMVFLVNDVIDLPPSTYTLRIGAASRVLATTGTVQVPLEVPKPSKGPLQISGLAIGLADTAREPVVGANLLKEIIPFQPTPIRAFAPADRLRVFARLFLSSKAVPMAALRLIDDAGTVVHEQPVGIVGSGGGERREATVDAIVPLGFHVGDYVLQFQVRTADGDIASRAIPITIR